MPPERTRRRQPACRECRYQKVKCDAEPPDACTRCRRMSLVCTTAPTRSARQTKAELQRELEAMRNHSSAAAQQETSSLPELPDSVIVGDEIPNLAMPATAVSPVPDLDPILAPAPVVLPAALDTSTQTLPQVLDDQEVSGQKIQDCFEIFFRSYAPFLPILDPKTTPNEYFLQSSFLFWTIVYLGSGRYDVDPTLLGRLAPKINAMAFLAIESRSCTIQTIQGTLLLCLWPVPTNTMHRSISLVLAGAALHLAMQIGLHVAGRGQDFARTILCQSRSEKIRRALLWKQCCFVYFTTGLGEGIVMPWLGDSIVLSAQIEAKLDSENAALYQSIKTRFTINDAAMSAIEALRRTQCEHDPQRSSALASCVSLFDSQLARLEQEAKSPLDIVFLLCYRLHVLAFHFLVDRESRKLDGFLSLYTIACRLIDTVSQQREDSPAFGRCCPAFVHRSLNLASLSILKIHRSELYQNVDLAAGEKAYFSAIVMVRQSSLENNDLNARGATILGQLWNSRTLFRRSNGDTDSLSSRIHSRLSMSAAFDCLWWWRQEFGGLENPYVDESRLQNNAARAASSTTETGKRVDAQEDGSDNGTLDQQVLGLPGSPQLLEDPFIDFDWAMTLNMGDWST